MKELLVVDEPARLLQFLRRRLPGWKVKTLEQRIRARCVRVNGAIVDRNDALAVGDEVIVDERESGAAARTRPLPAGIAVVHDDEDLIAIDKPAGLLSVSTSDEKARSALVLLQKTLSTKSSAARLWPVHRLDRESSGVMLFAKSRDARDAVQAAWADAHKVYLALVEGRPRPESGVIEQPLWEDRALNVHVGSNPDAQDARTRYATLEVFKQRTLLEVELDTGRRHQIRAHLAWIGHPIVGDPRFGSPAARMGLHALRLVLPHPADGRILTLEAPPPRAFVALMPTRTE